LLPKSAINKPEKKIVIKREIADKLNLLAIPQPKALVFVDSDNSKLQANKTLLNITLKEENKTETQDKVIYDVTEYSDDLNILEMGDNTLITISVFGER